MSIEMLGNFSKTFSKLGITMNSGGNTTGYEIGTGCVGLGCGAGNPSTVNCEDGYYR